MTSLQILPDPSVYNPILVYIATVQPTREVRMAGGYIYAEKRERKLKVRQLPLINWPYSLDNILYLNHTLLLNAILTT